MDFKRLLEKINKFAGEPEQRPGDQVRGTEKATEKKSGEHPFKGRLVGASESQDNLLKELEVQLKEGELQRELTNELNFFKTTSPAKPAPKKSYLQPEPAEPEEEEFEDKFYIKDGQKYLLHREGTVFQLSLGDQLIKSFTAPGKAVHQYLEQNGWKLQQSAVKHDPNWFKEGEDNPADTVQLDVPLLIRIMEYAREDAKTDMDLHNVAEKLVALSSQGRTLSMNDYDSVVSGDVEITEKKDDFGYKSLTPIIAQARHQFPMANNDVEALLMYIQSKEQKDVKRLDAVNDREDHDIDYLNQEEGQNDRKIDLLAREIQKLEAALANRNVEEEVAPAVATAGGPAGATQPKTGQPQDPAQVAAQKAQQAKLQQNLANLKSAGVDIDPAKAAQSLQKTDTGAPMTAADKDVISKMAPAIGNVMSNPSTATQLNTLIKKAGGGV